MKSNDSRNDLFPSSQTDFLEVLNDNLDNINHV